MRDKIIALAREAGNVTDFIPYLERFYQLAVAEEREECAKVCDSYSTAEHNFADICADEIRARKP